MFDFSEKQLLSVQSNKAQIPPCQTVLTSGGEKKFQRKAERLPVEIIDRQPFLI
jgi:hypothetical protein